jgi:hypothetical protein
MADGKLVVSREWLEAGLRFRRTVDEGRGLGFRV